MTTVMVTTGNFMVVESALTNNYIKGIDVKRNTNNTRHLNDDPNGDKNHDCMAPDGP